MHYGSRWSDRAFVAARPVLRKKLGFNQADYVAQCYQYLRYEHKAIADLTAQFELELFMIEMAIILARHAQLQRRDFMFVEASLSYQHNPGSRRATDTATSFESLSDVRNARASTTIPDTAPCLSKMTVCLPSTVDVKQHVDALQACVKTIDSLIVSLASESRSIQRLLDEMHAEALVSLRFMDDLHKELTRSSARAQSTQYKLGTRAADSTKVRSATVTLKSRAASQENTRSDPLAANLGPSEGALSSINHSSNSKNGSDSDPEFVFI